MEQIIFATFSIKLSDRETNVKLSHFEEGKDLLDYIERFFEEIHSGDIKTEDFKGKKKFHLRLENKGFRAEEDRCYYGWLSSGVSGDSYKIIELDTNIKKADVGIGDGAFKEVFFFFYIPHFRETGYLVLQRRGNFGVKIALEKSFRKYLKTIGLTSFTFMLFNLISGQVYEKMLEHGALKKIELIKSKIPKSLESFIKNNQEPDQIVGKLRTSITHKEELPSKWKIFLNKIYKSKGKFSDKYEVDSIDDSYDEVEFQLEYNGKKKNFYVVNQWKTQPDINVTDEYKSKYGNKINIHDLAKLAKSTIVDIFSMEPKING